MVCRTVGTQTDNVKQSNNLDTDFLMKLKSFLLELFQGKFVQENEKARDLLIQSAMRNHFSINVTQGEAEDIEGVTMES